MGKSMENFTEQKNTLGLYDPQFEHDACGIGAVVDIKGRKSHQTVDDALSIVERLEHRAGKDAEGKTGDGVGIMLQISHKFFSKVAEELNISLGNEREYGVGMFFFPQSEHLRAQAMAVRGGHPQRGPRVSCMAQGACEPGRRWPEGPRLHARHLAVLHQKARQGEQGH